MTAQTEFTSWQEHPKTPDPKTCSPICLSWMNYLIDRWGGQNLGCYNSRPVVGGSSLSSHGSGAATDWRYANPGPGRTVLLREVLPFFVEQSRELGVQAIHDYAGSRIWRPPGCSGRPGQPSPDCGWKQQSPGPQMGQSWATWIHLECLPSRWSDARTVEQMLEKDDDDMPLTDDDVQRIAKAVWEHAIGDPKQGEDNPAGWRLKQIQGMCRTYMGGFQDSADLPDRTLLQQIHANTKK